MSDDRRRARIARRHALRPGHRAVDLVDATRAMTALHATEPSTPHLSLAARVHDLTVADVERALYDDRSLVKVMAMRRTLFVVPRDLVPAVRGSAGRRVADTERRRFAKEFSGMADTLGASWIDDAADAIVDVLTGREMSTRELRDALPALGGTFTAAAGTKWATEMPTMTRLLTMLTAEGSVVRARNGGHWRTSRPRWTAMASWLGEPVPPDEPDAGYAEVVRRWLATFGPGTEADLVWWLGATKGIVRAALADVGAVAVSLDDGSPGWVRAEDVDELAQPDDDDEPWVALLPTLDPTTMGWRDRDFYLDPVHTPYLFDSVGNGGTTVWVDGRIVGCWVQDGDERVRPILLEEISGDARRLLDVEVARLDDFLAGEHVTNVFASPQMRAERLG